MKSTQWLRLLLLVVFIPTLVTCTTSSQEPAPTSMSVFTSTVQTAATLTPLPPATNTPSPAVFDGKRALQDVEKQVAFGPRIPGSEAHSKTVDWIKQELADSGWETAVQETNYQNQPVRNVIAKQGVGKAPWVILGAHFDSRMLADRDPNPENQNKPVPGANDGASGAAVLLELARVLPANLDKQVWLVFIDSEDQGDLPGWDWILGSRAFAESLSQMPDAVVIIDMIGDAELNIPKERNSSPDLVSEIWDVAAQQGHSQFLPQNGYAMLDDHTPFLERGIRAIDIIDFDYNYWHTTEDTPDKVSAESLFAVGDTLLHWLSPKN
ncbi:MAG: M28 family peptidase [Anaerolineaceae bacterium]|nr:M28 family peptidase [Anaerolineaceae bacterium]